ncbi:MAG: NADH dehydrogenase (quinone) subunit D [Bdellovibrionaceae bacterium]|nr:NADH dehydrogenase (quinone) subunit D [Pseudobdellovibrionaceae bacterium]
MRAIENLQKDLTQKFQKNFVFKKILKADVILLSPDELIPVLHHLKEKHYFDFLMCVSGVHYPEKEQAFEVCYELLSSKNMSRLRIKILVNEEDQIPTAQFVYPTADWFEREIYDMYGLKFKNHPNMKRILTHHQFKGYPLRKDYPADLQQHLSEPLEFCMDNEPDGTAPDDKGKDLIPLNIGPSHPATHGTLRIMALMDGEKVHRANVEIGYLHRCFEKMAEEHPYNQVIPYTDRLNYCSSPMNNVGYCKAVEEMLGVDIPPKAQAMRIILCELSRIIDHIVCIGAAAFDLGALTGFFHAFTYREKVYTIFEKLCGARLTVSMTRVGGMANEPPENWFKDILQFCKEMRVGIDEIDTLLTNNKIWMERNQKVGSIDTEQAISWGYTGPCLRSTGLGLDLRKSDPYYAYETLDFEVPVGTTGDAYDRYLVRVEEMRQSVKIIEQICKNVPSGDYSIRDKDIVLPEKKDVYGNIEGLMNHFMLVIHGLRAPKGECYSVTEAANGELGFYLVSDGGPKPYRLKVRPPCFAIYQSFPHCIRGSLTADVVTLLGSMNIIAGELDR